MFENAFRRQGDRGVNEAEYVTGSQKTLITKIQGETTF